MRHAFTFEIEPFEFQSEFEPEYAEEFEEEVPGKYPQGALRKRRLRQHHRRCRCPECAPQTQTEFGFDGIGDAIRRTATRVSDALGVVDGSRIIDLTAKADKSNRKGTRDPKSVYALVLHQMACCANRKDPLKSYLKIGSHFAILRDGKILQLHPVSALVWASNGFNSRSVAVEFAGNLPSTRGKWWKGDKYGKNHLTPEQVDAGRYLIRWLIKSMGLTHVLAHRQSSGTRENDPGPDIWYHVGQWAIDNLKLRDGGPGFKIGTGNAIPDEWRRWNKPLTAPDTPSKEMQFEETDEIAHEQWEAVDFEADEFDAQEFELFGGHNAEPVPVEQEWQQERPYIRRAPPKRTYANNANRKPGPKPATRLRSRSRSRSSRVFVEPGYIEHGTEFGRWVQSTLNRVLGLRLPVTGVIDAAMRSAIRSFQEQHRLPVDGIVGPEVERALLDAQASNGAPAESPDDGASSEFFEVEDFELEAEVSRTSRDYIVWVQNSLNRLNNAGLVEDGVSGPLTRAAVQKFQRSKGLDADGIVGPITEAALLRAGAAPPPDATPGAPGTTPPTTTVPVDTPLPASGTGYYSYTSPDKRYGTAATISAIQSIASAWNRANASGPRLGIGNISKRGGGEFPPHSTHREGLNVDIRPVRNDRGESRVKYTDRSYSRSLTQELVNLIYANPVLGVSSILFNDSSVQRVKPYEGHDDHLHVTFKRPSSTTPPSTVPVGGNTLRDRIVQIALQERKRWRDGALKEWDVAARSILVDYWLTGVGMPASDAARFADNLYAWSAAFICWVLRKAGAGNNFAYSSYHSTYIAAAYKNAQQQSANAFKAYSTEQTAPRLGDLICTTYSSNGVRPPAELSQVRANTGGYHCDIVVLSALGKLTVIGGNLSDSVGLKIVSIDTAGKVTDPAYFAVLQTG